jgi:outer membrane protein
MIWRGVIYRASLTYPNNMNSFTLRLCALFALACFFNPARAQSKVGYIDLQQLISAMPESSAASAQIESLTKSQNGQATALGAQLEAKSKALQKDLSPLDGPSRLAKEAEIQSIVKQLLETQMSTQLTLQARTTDLRTQAIEKVKQAISQVATEGGYTLVIQVSQSDVLFSNQKDNLLPAVKAKLGIK